MAQQMPSGCRGVLTEENMREIQQSPNGGLGRIIERLNDENGGGEYDSGGGSKWNKTTDSSVEDNFRNGELAKQSE
jgi:hypothetical protein